MARFAEYRSSAGHAPLAVVVRPARIEDADALTELVLEREGGDPSVLLRGFEREAVGFYPREGHRLFVAVHEGRAVGFGRSKHFQPLPDAGPPTAPAGWYLGGVIVRPALRRRGIGRELTRARLDDLRGEASEVFYIASSLNRASLDLHAEFGFVELTREFDYPGVVFDGGEGVLYRLALD